MLFGCGWGKCFFQNTNGKGHEEGLPTLAILWLASGDKEKYGTGRQESSGRPYFWGLPTPSPQNTQDTNLSYFWVSHCEPRHQVSGSCILGWRVLRCRQGETLKDWGWSKDVVNGALSHWTGPEGKIDIRGPQSLRTWIGMKGKRTDGTENQVESAGLRNIVLRRRAIEEVTHLMNHLVDTWTRYTEHSHNYSGIPD